MKMKKESKCGCQPKPTQMVLDVIEVLEREVSNYSIDYVPERISRIRDYIKQLNNSCCP